MPGYKQKGEHVRMVQEESSEEFYCGAVTLAYNSSNDGTPPLLCTKCGIVDHWLRECNNPAAVPGHHQEDEATRKVQNEDPRDQQAGPPTWRTAGGAMTLLH